ncbi:MAG: gfo/Idh/MocA family oxidoreductase [Bacteroidetes bacterium]|nr:MAG: gfo/Idh/MocA family oxidoreductase [Bacteroidota bacterium]
MKKNKLKTENTSDISRRNFVKMAATGTAAFTILPSYTVSGLGHVSPSDKLYIAAIGCGGQGGYDIDKLVSTPKKNAVISCLCDVDERQAAPTRKAFPKASFYQDWRELFEKEHKNFDAVTVAIPDHNHALVSLRAMQLQKHLYLQKPLTHDIYEARILTEASEKYKVVTQMGDQGNSGEGMKTLREWIEADVLGEIEKVYCWTDRPVWPQGIPWPSTSSPIPKELNWDLWLGTAPDTPYIENLVPFNWRGWWRFGTGALGDMGCHIMGPPFKLLNLGYPTEVSGSASTVYDGIISEANFPESGPVSCSLKFKYTLENGKDLDLYWMDGGITPERPDEINTGENMNDIMGDWPEVGDYEGSTLFVGTKGKAACGWGGRNPVLLPLSRNNEINVPKKYPRVHGGMDGHYWQWIDACIAGYGNAEVESPFVGYAGPLTETVLMGNLVLRCFNIREKTGTEKGTPWGDLEFYDYPGRYINYNWDGPNMRVTNFEQANQFVKREYRKGWGELSI